MKYELTCMVDRGWRTKAGLSAIWILGNVKLADSNR